MRIFKLSDKTGTIKLSRRPHFNDIKLMLLYIAVKYLEFLIFLRVSSTQQSFNNLFMTNAYF